MSSSGDDGGGYFPGMGGAATPMPGLPVAGKDSVVGDPYKYGKFQQFLPDDLIHETGRNDNATGLRPDMFRYRGPNEGSDPRDELAKTIAAPACGGGGGGGGGGAAAGGTNWGPLFSQMSQQDLATWQMTMNNAGRGDEAASALNMWRNSMSQPGGGGGGGWQQAPPQQPVYQDSFGGGATGAGSDGSY